MNKTEFINKLNEFCKSEIIENENFIKDRDYWENLDEWDKDEETESGMTSDIVLNWDFDERENAIYEAGMITAYQNIIQFLKNNL